MIATHNITSAAINLDKMLSESHEDTNASESQNMKHHEATNSFPLVHTDLITGQAVHFYRLIIGFDKLIAKVQNRTPSPEIYDYVWGCTMKKIIQPTLSYLSSLVNDSVDRWPSTISLDDVILSLRMSLQTINDQRINSILDNITKNKTTLQKQQSTKDMVDEEDDEEDESIDSDIEIGDDEESDNDSDDEHKLSSDQKRYPWNKIFSIIIENDLHHHPQLSISSIKREIARQLRQSIIDHLHHHQSADARQAMISKLTQYHQYHDMMEGDGDDEGVMMEVVKYINDVADYQEHTIMTRTLHLNELTSTGKILWDNHSRHITEGPLPFPDPSQEGGLLFLDSEEFYVLVSSVMENYVPFEVAQLGPMMCWPIQCITEQYILSLLQHEVVQP